jgi:hypothetical protein
MSDILSFQNLILFLSGVIVPIVVALINKKLEAKKLSKTDKLESEIKTCNVVNNKLDNIREEVKADRVWVMQFHNGGHYYPTGKSIQKFSMFYESVEPGCDSIKLLFQNIPVSLFAPSANKILTDNVIEIPDFKNENISTYGLKYTAQETGSKSTYMFGIRDINNKLIGTLGIDFTKRKKYLDQEDIQILEVEATQIGGVLHNHLTEK